MSFFFLVNKIPSCPQTPALKKPELVLPRQNEVRSLCLQHIMNSSAITAFPAEVCWAKRRERGREGRGVQGCYKWKKCQRIKEVGALNQKVKDWFMHYPKYQKAIFSKCESDLRRRSERAETMTNSPLSVVEELSLAINGSRVPSITYFWLVGD